MANKRGLKKGIKYICGDIAGECILASYTVEGIDIQKLNELIIKTAELQDNTVKKVSVSFDKNLKSFDGDAKEHNKAKRKYFKNCYTTLINQFNDSVKEIVKEMNSLRPAEQK